MEGKKRYRLLDFLRGVSLVNMVAYHLLYDLVYLFGVRIEWYHGAGAYWWQQLICGSFILFAGASCRLSRNNLKRGAQLLAFGVVLGRVTAFVMPQQQVRFGILHFMGIACLLAGLLRPVLERVMPACGSLVALFFFLLTRGVGRGWLGFLGHPLVYLPEGLYQTAFLYPLGFPGPEFFSSDYFPLLPWFFLFLLGFFLWPMVQGMDVLEWPQQPNPISWAGRRTVWIYLAHQPVLYGICWMLERAGVL